MNDRVKEVAALVRKAVEVQATRQGYPRDLCGMCAIASFTLATALAREGVIAYPVVGSVHGYSHCWVEAEGKVFDITATQFAEYRNDELLSFPVSKKDLFGYHTHDELTIGSARELKSWPLEQQPEPKLVAELLESMKRFA